MAADPELPDFDALVLERVQLQRQLSELERRHEWLQQQLATFPNEVAVIQERRVASELAEVVGRIDKIDATIIRFRLTW